MRVAQAQKRLAVLGMATPAEVAEVQELFVKALGVRKQYGTAELVACARRVVDEHEQYGKLTIRQLYYQLVTRGVIPNDERSYKRFVVQTADARRAEIIPWNSFEDRARLLLMPQPPRYLAVGDPAKEVLRFIRGGLGAHLARCHGLPRWEGQPYSVELWVEKDALAGFLRSVAEECEVPLVVSRGYTSVTFKYEARARFEASLENDQQAVLLYLGDLDPSGEDIYHCLERELSDVAILERVALLPDDVSRYDLVPCPVKDTDTRAVRFKQRHRDLGGSCYELDALPPAALLDRARASVERYFDLDIYEENQREVRAWRANFVSAQADVRRQLKEGGFDPG